MSEASACEFAVAPSWLYAQVSMEQGANVADASVTSPARVWGDAAAGPAPMPTAGRH
jgi:uncharacterized protein YpuA (DUF1002 family)